MDMDVREALGLVIQDKGLKQNVLAEKAKLTPMQLSDILNKRRKLEANEMFSLCEVMDVTADELRRYEKAEDGIGGKNND